MRNVSYLQEQSMAFNITRSVHDSISSGIPVFAYSPEHKAAMVAIGISADDVVILKREQMLLYWDLCNATDEEMFNRILNVLYKRPMIGPIQPEEFK